MFRVPKISGTALSGVRVKAVLLRNANSLATALLHNELLIFQEVNDQDVSKEKCPDIILADLPYDDALTGTCTDSWF